MNTETYIVRDVRKNDLPALAQIEQARWKREDTEILPIEKLEEWYRSNSPFFLLAERNGEVSGFYYGIQVHFEMNAIEKHTAAEAQTNHGQTIHAHDSTGTSVYAVNVVVTAPEVGVLLNAEVHRRIKQLQMVYFIGVSRLVHLDHYLRGIERDHGGTLPYPEAEIALWYAHESMKLIATNKTWPECSLQPTLDLPPLRRPDSILKFHTETINAGLLRIIPNFMRDPKSRNYGAFLATKFNRI